MNPKVIAFIGGGNMASSMIGGVLARGWDGTHIWVSDPVAECRERLAELGVHTTADNRAACAAADVIVLAVKPQQMRQVCENIASQVQARGALVISIAAGIETASLRTWLGGVPLVRCMPNTPALLRCGATALYATEGVGQAAQQVAHEILQSIGTVAWVDREELLHGVTALSGSGPAYFFLMMEAMQQAGEKLGLDAELSRALTAQTALGAARMALESGLDVIELRRRVTSPGGTTERAVGVLEQRDLRQTLDEALAAAAARSRELAEELGRD